MHSKKIEMVVVALNDKEFKNALFLTLRHDPKKIALNG